MLNEAKKIESEAIWAPSNLIGMSAYSNQKSSYGEFRKSLKPQYIKNSLPLATTLAMIFSLLLITTKLNNLNGLINFACILIISVFLGLVAHRQLLLVHEGAHFHLAKNRFFNDVLSNLFAGIFVGTEIKSYRFIHNKHHQGLGTDLDPENSYSEEFDLTWLFTALLGIRVIKTLFKRQKIEQSGKQLLMLNASACFHLVVLILLNEFLGITSSIAWGLGYFIVMPFFGSIRNVLEHKYEMDQIDLKKIESIEGITLPIYTTRLFTEKLMSKIFGVVGFDRHLIHHWDPSISALNLGKVNEFLLTTELGPMLRDLPTTYTKAFLRLMKNG